MRTVTIAVLSFVLGTTLTSLYGSQTSKPQPVPPPQQPSLDAGRVPVVPQGFGFMSPGILVKGGIVVLDGYNCAGCTFEDITLRYGGGVFAFGNAKMGGTVKIELTGAAANTVAFLSNLGIGLCKFTAPVQRTHPNAPIVQTAQFENPITINLQSPYGQP